MAGLPIPSGSSPAPEAVGSGVAALGFSALGFSFLRLLVLRRPRLLRGRLAGQLLDLADLEPGQFGAVALTLAVAVLGLVLEDLDLLAALVVDDLGLDLDLLERARVEHHVVVGAQHHGAQGDLGALVIGELVDEQGLALLDAVLLAAGLDDRVGRHVGFSVSQQSVGLAGCRFRRLRRASNRCRRGNGACRPYGRGAVERRILDPRRRLHRQGPPQAPRRPGSRPPRNARSARS